MNVRPIRTWIDGTRQYTAYQAEDTLVTWINNSGTCGSCRTPGLRLMSRSCRHVAEVRRHRLPRALPFSTVEPVASALPWDALGCIVIALLSFAAAVAWSIS